MSYESTSSDEALYALLGLPLPPVSESTSNTQNDGITRSIAGFTSPSQTTGQVELDTEESPDSAQRARKKKKRGRSSRLRRTTEREMQRIGMAEDSDEAVKETAHTGLVKVGETTDKLNENNPITSDKPDEKKTNTTRSNPYWMYGEGLVIPPYVPAGSKEDNEESGNVVEQEKAAEVEVKKEEPEVMEKDFADAYPEVAKKEDLPIGFAKEAGIDDAIPAKRFKAEDLLNQLIDTMENSTRIATATHLEIGSLAVSDVCGRIEVKQEESVPMAKIPTSTTDEGLTTADESFHTDTDTETIPKTRRQFHVVQHQSPIKGSNKRRVRYQIVRHIRPIELDEVVEEVKVEEDPLPDTAFKRDLQHTFSRAGLLQVLELAKIDNTSGNHLPSHLRDLFPALSDPASAITIANHLRKQFDLPLLSIKTDRVALRRAVAQMRLGIYTELVSALLLPSAPEPAPDTDDEEIKEKVKKISLIPSALQYLQKALPAAFPEDKFAIKVFLANHDPLGEIKGRVVWQDGIGTIVGGDPNGPAFRGKISGEGLIHVFVDHSNVLHGLSQRLKNNTSPALPRRHLRTLSLPILSLLLRRGRPTPHGTLHLVASSPLYQNLDPLVRLGWEVSVLKRVEIYDDEVHDSHSAKLVPKPLNNFVKVNAFHEGGSRRYKEQGVDEILHLKILQALNTKPTPAPKGSTIVLATGDAKGGQFNQDGFVGAVREAIKRGWMVELWSFSEGLSRAWKDLKKKEKWGGDFTIKLLDEWSEQLVEVGDGD